MNQSEEEEFQEMQTEISDPDPVVRGVAAVDLGSFALDHSEYKEKCVVLLQKALSDSDQDVRTSAQKSLEMIAGKQLFEPGGQVIGFGFMPDDYKQDRPEVDPKQMIISCVCCIVMIVVIVFLFIPW